MIIIAFLFLQPTDALADDFGFAIGAVDDGRYFGAANTTVDNQIDSFAKEFVDEFGVGDVVALHAVGQGKGGTHNWCVEQARKFLGNGTIGHADTHLLAVAEDFGQASGAV